MLLQGSVTVLSGVAVNDVINSVEDFSSPEKKEESLSMLYKHLFTFSSFVTYYPGSRENILDRLQRPRLGQVSK